VDSLILSLSLQSAPPTLFSLPGKTEAVAWMRRRFVRSGEMEAAAQSGGIDVTAWGMSGCDGQRRR
jgi:hypothetical protein